MTSIRPHGYSDPVLVDGIALDLRKRFARVQFWPHGALNSDLESAARIEIGVGCAICR